MNRSDESPPSANTHAERLLACFGKACNHDLSNQMVALQGMLHLLQHEEQERLSEQGKDELRRAVAAARRAADMVQTLKDLMKWAACAEKTEQITLLDLVRTVQTELSRLYSDRTVEYDLSIAAPVVTAGRRGLFRLLVDLGRLAVSVAPEGKVRVEIASTASAAGVEIRLGLSQDALPGRPGAPAFAGLEHRFEFLVARELAATWNAAVTLQERGPTFVLRFAE